MCLSDKYKATRKGGFLYAQTLTCHTERKEVSHTLQIIILRLWQRITFVIFVKSVYILLTISNIDIILKSE